MFFLQTKEKIRQQMVETEKQKEESRNKFMEQINNLEPHHTHLKVYLVQGTELQYSGYGLYNFKMNFGALSSSLFLSCFCIFCICHNMHQVNQCYHCNIKGKEFSYTRK